MFSSLEDFCQRIDPKLVNRRVLESLICAGAFDCFGHDRAALLAGLDRIIGLAQRTQEDLVSGQADIFGSAGTVAKIVLPDYTPQSDSERLMREYQMLGYYQTAHPLDAYGEVLARMRVQEFAAFELSVKNGSDRGRLAGTVVAKQERKTRTGNRMGIIMFSDATGQFEAVLFSEMLYQYRDLLEPGTSVVITVAAEMRPEGIGMRIQTVQSLEEEAVRQQRAMRVYVRDDLADSLACQASESEW
nr:OB-fold nucleic acid binding domain-containing protein [Marinicella sp. W31]MDC2877533.1 OB-fold nucleic acid binding domain-containing protein [Marinicella sp. W31]